MITITKQVEFDYGHCLKDHVGKCQHFHGHRGKLIARFAGVIKELGPETGMVKAK